MRYPLVFNLQVAIAQDHILEMMKIVMDCALKEQATEDDMKELFELKQPTTKSGNCLHACISEQLGLVSFIF